MPVSAQNSQAPAPQPHLIPGLEHFSLPSSPNARPILTVPSPTPTPTAAPTPAPSPTPTRARTVAPVVLPAAPPSKRATPTPLAVPTKRATPTPLPTPRPAPAETPVSSPVVTPTEAAPPAPLPTEAMVPIPPVAANASASAAAAEPAATSFGLTPFLAIGGGAALLILLGWLATNWYRRREEPDAVPVAPERRSSTTFDLGAVDPVPPPPAPAPPPEPVPAPLPVDVPRAQLEIEVRPKRAGTNLLSAAVEYEVIVRNTGAVAAQAIRVDIRMLSAGAQQDATIHALFAAPIDKPVTPPFDLGAGEHAALDGTAMMPREAVSPMMMQGRALFVPVLTVSLVYDWDGGTGQTATAHVIGIDRGEGTKMAPFRIDGPPRMHSGVSQLPYTIAVRR